MSTSDKIILISSDGERFEVSEAVAREFEIIAHMLEDGCTDNTVPITTIHSTILSKVIEYCTKHVQVGNVEENEEAKKGLKDWDQDFINVDDMNTLIEIILAANYLNIKGLLDISCQKVADRIKDKQPEELRSMFNIENDFTDEEEAKIREDNPWAFERDL